MSGKNREQVEEELARELEALLTRRKEGQVSEMHMNKMLTQGLRLFGIPQKYRLERQSEEEDKVLEEGNLTGEGTELTTPKKSPNKVSLLR